MWVKKNLQGKKDGDMEAPIEIVEDLKEDMIGAMTEDRIEVMTEAATEMVMGGAIRIGGTIMITEVGKTNLVKDTMTETIVTGETIDLAEDTMKETIVIKEKVDLVEDMQRRRAPQHCPPVMTFTKRCDAENERT